MSVESTERIEEEESGQLSRPSTMESVKHMSDNQIECEHIVNCDTSKIDNQHENTGSATSSNCLFKKGSSLNDDNDQNIDEVEILQSEEDEERTKHGVKRW